MLSLQVVRRLGSVLVGMLPSLNGMAGEQTTGWGIDACLTTHVDAETRAFYFERLHDSGLRWLRERQPEASMADLQRKGYRVVAFTHLSALAPKDPANQLAEDLRLVFAAAKAAQHTAGQTIDAWEMAGEPDIGFCTDLPDRVAAYQKALYLGIKAGARSARTAEGGGRMAEDGYRTADGGRQMSDVSRRSSDVGQQQAPLVLMGALGMPPGPWLERAAANGLLDYTDAYNFHFYGHAAHLTGVIEAHREALRRLLGAGYSLSGSDPSSNQPATDNQQHASMPLWITEAGIEAVDKKDFLNPQRRQLQADFTISTAKQALAAEDVAVFMPFILVHDKDPYAMTLSPWKTFPAWDAYAKFTRENPWPKRALSREPRAVSPVVMQWLPDNRTTVPHKVSGTYRFRDGAPIRGELRVYNFGDKPVKGRLERGAGSGEPGALTHVTAHLKAEGIIEIPAMGMVAIPLEFTASTKGYFRETWSAVFVEVGRVVPNALNEDHDHGGLGISRSTFESRVSFGLEAWAKLEDFAEEPLALRPLPNGVIKFPQIEPYAKGEQVGVWTTMNGLKGKALKPETGNLKPEKVGFWIEKENTDPLAPTMAVAAVVGLPSTGFIRLQLDKPMTKDRKVLVVLVDDRGQRYSIWENFGADYYTSRRDIWLNLADFHADFWGPMSADYQFRPERIREVHLRLYLSTPNDPVQVELTMLTAKQ